MVWISLSSKPSWYLEMNPIGKVPLLINKEGKTIVESDVIMRYLDETSGNKRLMSLCGETEWKRAGMLASKVIFSHPASFSCAFYVIFLIFLVSHHAENATGSSAIINGSVRDADLRLVGDMRGCWHG